MTWSIYSLPEFAVGTLMLSLGVFVLLQNRQCSLNRTFFGFCLVCVIWLYGFGFMYLCQTRELADFWTKVLYIGVVFTPALFHHCIREFLHLTQRKRFLIFVYMGGAIFCYMSWADLLLKMPNPYYRFYWGYYPAASPLHPLFMIYIVTVSSYTLYLLFKRYKEKKQEGGVEFQRVQYVAIAFIIAHLILENFCATYDIVIYPIASFSIGIFAIVIAYAIVKHRLMDINFVIQRGLVYSVLIAIITTLYLLFIFLAEKMFQNITGYQSLPISVFSVVVLAFLFHPIRSRIQYVVDRYFFKGTQEMLAEENVRLKEQIERSERLRTMGPMAAGLAHEIKNPLAAIKTFTQYLPERGEEPAFREKYHRIVTREVNRIHNLAQQLLDFSRLNAPQLVDIHIETLLDEILELLSEDFLKKHVEVVKHYANTDAVISADPQKIKQVFLNLILNSVEAMALSCHSREDGLSAFSGLAPIGGNPSESPNGCHSRADGLSALAGSPPLGGNPSEPPKELSFPHASSGNPNKTLTLTTKREENNIIITIQDTGKGIAEEDIPKLFDPFFTTKETGSGLGLSVVHSIIEQHKGDITVESAVGVGTAIRVILPIEK